MNLRRLEMFVAVAEELHFGRAAQRLHVAQPPLSQQIRALEQELGIALFVRDSRNVRLTSEGEQLLTAARRVLAEADAFDALVHGLHHGDVGRLRLGFVSSAAISYVPPLVRAFHEFAPGIELELQEATTEQQLDAVAVGRLDAGIVRELDDPHGLVIAHRESERLVLAVPHSHHLAKRDRITLGDLEGERFITLPRDQISRLYGRIEALLSIAGVRFHVEQEADQFLTILGLVASGLGVAVVPASMKRGPVEGVRYLSIDHPDAVSEVSLIASPTSGPVARRFAEITSMIAWAAPEM